jgi:hypothetical protein
MTRLTFKVMLGQCAGKFWCSVMEDCGGFFLFEYIQKVKCYAVTSNGAPEKRSNPTMPVSINRILLE